MQTEHAVFNSMVAQLIGISCQANLLLFRT